VEQYLVKWRGLEEGGATIEGAPITIQLSRPIEDLDAFRLCATKRGERLAALRSGESATWHRSATAAVPVAIDGCCCDARLADRPDS
jgi:hypothetical protein